MNLTKYLSLNFWTAPTDSTPEDGIKYLRERILLSTLVIFVFFGLFTYGLSLQASAETDFMTLVTINTISYGTILFLIIKRKMNYNFRAITIIITSYILGFLLILYLGPGGTGLIWLFLFPVLSIVLYNRKIAIIAIILNALALTLAGFYFVNNPQYLKHSSEEIVKVLIIAGINYILLNIITTFSISVILKGLAASLTKEKKLRVHQKIINDQLRDANLQLTREMTEKQEIENSLTQKNIELYALINSIPDMIWLKDNNSRYITVNNAFYRTTLACADDVINKTGVEYFGESATTRYINSDREVMSSGKSLIMEEKGIDYEGNDIWFETIKAPITNNEGVSTGTVGIAHNITIRRKIHNEIHELNNTLEDRIEKRTTELMEANKQLLNEIEERKNLQNHLLISERFAATGQLASSIAHEINSPLQGIISLLNVLEKTHGNDLDFIENINLIKGAFSNIKETVGDLQNLNRPSENIKRVENVNTIIKQSVSLFKSYLKKNKIKFTLNLSDSIQESKVSAQEINQCLVNLVNNAIEAITSETSSVTQDSENIHIGEIKISTFMKKDRIMISVHDTGPGIREELLDKVFDPFYTHKKQYGMGIGLSVCIKIMENHKGNITADNDSAGGAIFRISLPTYTPSGVGSSSLIIQNKGSE